MARGLFLAVIIGCPLWIYASALSLAEEQLSKGIDGYVQVTDDVKEEISIAFKERVDVYEAPCGKGFEVIVNAGDTVEYIGYGCEAKERTRTINRKALD